MSPANAQADHLLVRITSCVKCYTAGHPMKQTQLPPQDNGEKKATDTTAHTYVPLGLFLVGGRGVKDRLSRVWKTTLVFNFKKQ